MSVDVTKAHGADAGCEPPPNPTSRLHGRIPTKRKGRGVAIGKDLDEVRRKTGKPLKVRFCPQTRTLLSHGRNTTRRNTTNDFVKDDVRQDYETLKVDFELQTQQASGATSNDDGSTIVGQVEVLQKVLGQRRGHERRVGQQIEGVGVIIYPALSLQRVSSLSLMFIKKDRKFGE
ncbi:uncharacterized protein LOC133780163 [Humulus lupulus]|uniref:uncharacterized protein LOC133780163 n=1 Tax=Humulus lupulus TaxID=3486 RepID=UPI002B413B3E|nr:uncharacterized protein LOC133780163 [Humulus lupulus]